jgi:hypothetical protein
MLQKVVHILFLNCYKKQKKSWSNSPSPSAINNYFSIFLSPFPLTPMMMNNNGSRPPTLNKTSKNSNGIHVKKHWN